MTKNRAYNPSRFAFLAGWLLLAVSSVALAEGGTELFQPGPDQWLQWEQQANTARFRKPDAIPIKVVKVPLSDVTVTEAKGLPAEIRDRFIRDGHVLYPLHPHNTSPAVPFQDLEAHTTWNFRTTASRSVSEPAGQFTVKLPTNHPHGPTGAAQAEKASIQDEIDYEISRTAHIEAADHRLGTDKNMVVLKDVLTIQDRKTKNGVVVRDLTPMRSDHIYVPALSIPYVGEEIARRNGQDFAAFWRKHDAIPYGKIKAQFLLRYGLVFETPNAQNRLIEFDKNLKPTGRIFLRDVVDSFFYAPFVKALGIEGVVSTDLVRHFSPNASNSYWQMDEHTSSAIVKEWTQAHEDAYRAEIARVTGTDAKTLSFTAPLPEAAVKKLQAYHQHLATQQESTARRATSPKPKVIGTARVLANRRGIRSFHSSLKKFKKTPLTRSDRLRARGFRGVRARIR